MWKKEAKAFERLLSEKKNFFMVDTETTGLSPDTEKIIQFSALKVVPNGDTLDVVDEIDVYINPEKPLDPKITEITGLTDADLADKPVESVVFPQILAFMGEHPIFVAYNTPFDLKFVKALYGRQGKVLDPEETLDVLAMAREMLKRPDDVPDHKLGTVATHFGIDAKFHSSIEDIKATKDVLDHLIELNQPEPEAERRKVKVNKVAYWEKSFGKMPMKRLYVETEAGSVYFNCVSKSWGEKDEGISDVIDMEDVVRQVYEMTGTSNDEELSNYRN